MLCALALAGCSTVVDTVGETFIQPGKYNFLRCQEIAQQITGMEARSKELHELTDRANASAGGPAVNMLVYGPDLREVDASLRLLRKTSGEKRCDDDKAPGKETAKIPIAPPATPAGATGNLGPLH
jgi:hypothetical protein